MTLRNQASAQNKFIKTLFPVGMMFLVLGAGYLSTIFSRNRMLLLLGLPFLGALWYFLGFIGLFSIASAFIWVFRPLPVIDNLFALDYIRSISIVEGAIYGWFVLFVGISILKKGRGFILPPYIGILFIFALCGIIALLSGVSSNAVFSFRMWLKVCVIPVILCILLVNYLKSSKDSEWLVLGLILGSLVLALVLLTDFGYHGMPSWMYLREDWAQARYVQDHESRLAGEYLFGPLGGIYVEPNGEAYYLGLTISLAFSLAGNGKKRWQRIFGMIVVGVTGLIIFWLGTRTIWIGLPFSFGAIVWLGFLQERSAARWRPILMLLFILLALVLVIQVGVLYGLFNQNLLSRVTMSPDLLQKDNAWLWRINVWQSAIRILQQHPLGSGYLIGSASLPDVHNEYLAIALTTGLEGLFAFLTFLFFWLRYLFKALRSRVVLPHGWILPGGVGCGVIFFFSAMTADSSKTPYQYIVFWIIVGVTLVTARDFHNEKKNLLQRHDAENI